jgi:hypothetical protein
MNKSWAYWRKHQMLAGLTVGLVSLVIADCSGPGSTSSSVNALPLQAGMPLVSPTPFTFDFVTADDPASPTFTRVLGVDNLGAVRGYSGSGSKSDPSHGFRSLPPYTQFRSLNYPAAIDTVATSLNSSRNRITAGYFVDSTSGHTTWGFLKLQGVFAQYKDPKTPKGPHTVNELLGVNDPGVAVGFYKDSEGHDMPYELVIGSYHPIHPPAAVSAKATGINLTGDIAGAETIADGVTKGWLWRSGVYSEFSYPGSKHTEATALNIKPRVVGFYVDSAGTHGFILTKPGSPTEQYWQSVDEPNAAGITVITSINVHNTISGWYVDSSGNTNGFVATVAASR